MYILAGTKLFNFVFFYIIYNSFINCNFNTNLYGIVFGTGTVLGGPNQTTGPSFNTITNCTFDEISNSYQPRSQKILQAFQ